MLFENSVKEETVKAQEVKNSIFLELLMMMDS